MTNLNANTITNLINEQWKPIQGYESRYMISNLGRVKSLSYIQYYTDKNGKKVSRNKPEHILKHSITNSGYATVILFNKEYKSKGYSVHRLVAKHFLTNWNPNLEVDHIDRNKLNNTVTNLHMVDRKQNMQNVIFKGIRPVNKYNQYGEYICTYPNVMTAAKCNNIYPNKLYVYLKGIKNINTQDRYEYATRDKQQQYIDYNSYAKNNFIKRSKEAV